jgi:anthraniloyl-CoA monooxygenase
MKIVCIGGGPAGLYFGLLMKMRNPAHDITVVERNKPYDTFGWGVVFSDATMDNMRQWDPVTAAEIQHAFNHWDDIELEFKGEVIRSGGHGFVGIGRKKLLNILQAALRATRRQSGLRRPTWTGRRGLPGGRPHHRLRRHLNSQNPRQIRRHRTSSPTSTCGPMSFRLARHEKALRGLHLRCSRKRPEHGWFQAHAYKLRRRPPRPSSSNAPKTRLARCTAWITMDKDEAIRLLRAPVRQVPGCATA